MHPSRAQLRKLRDQPVLLLGERFESSLDFLILAMLLLPCIG